MCHIYIYIYICMNMCVCTHTHTRSHTHTHTHTHTLVNIVSYTRAQVCTHQPCHRSIRTWSRVILLAASNSNCRSSSSDTCMDKAVFDSQTAKKKKSKCIICMFACLLYVHTDLLEQFILPLQELRHLHGQGSFWQLVLTVGFDR